MKRKSNEKAQSKGTKENQTLNLDNEIVIGLKTIEEPKKSKTKINKNTKDKQPSSKNKRVNKKVKKSKNVKENKTKFSPTKSNKKIQEEVIIKQPKDKNKKITQKQEIVLKKRKIIFKIVKWTSLFIILVVGAIYFLLSPFFNIKNIIVQGNEKISEAEIISLSEIKLEENTFKVSKKEIEKLIKQNAYIDKVFVKRKLPNTIEITVDERTPSYILNFANAYVYVSSQGYLLEITNQNLNLPVIMGYETSEENIKVGNRLCKEDLTKLEDLLRIMEAANSNELSNLITQINIKDKDNYILELETEKKAVHLGDTSNLSTKMLYILKIIEEEKENEGEILVNTDLNNKGAVFREKV